MRPRHARLLIVTVIIAIGALAGGYLLRRESVNDRRVLAERLVARLDSLSGDEEERLMALGDDAFRALLPVVRERMANVGPSARRGADEENYWLFHVAFRLLSGSSTAAHTPAMLALLRDSTTPGTERTIVDWLMEKGDSHQAMPALLDVLQAEPPGPSVPPGTSMFDRHTTYRVVLDFVVKSPDPRAQRFLIDSLADDKATRMLRRAAFLNLSRTAGDAGVKAVIGARDVERTLPPLVDFVKPHRQIGPLTTYRDQDGVTWALFPSGALGDGRDLWLARDDGSGGWRDPVFTGRERPPAIDDDLLPGILADATIRLDSDGDGWTDVAEARLGTDAASRDSDGDGLPDGQDRNPLAAPRSLTEDEQVLEAAFHARFRFAAEPPVPCLLRLPTGVQPFEVSGWGWFVVAVSEGAETPPFADRGWSGTGFAGFGNRRRADAPLIEWSADRTEAKVEVEIAYGGLHASGYLVHLRRVGGAWVPIAVENVWVS